MSCTELFFLAYNESKQTRNIRCSPGKLFDQESVNKSACQFNRDSLGPCSGLQDENFGYDKGTPCVIIKMNRVSSVSLLDFIRLSVFPVENCCSKFVAG